MTLIQERIEDLSVYYFISDLFSGTPSIKIVDGFPESILTVPTISIDARRLDSTNFEMGNKKRLLTRSWYIDVFAQNKSQRDDIGYTILHALEDCIPVYDYNSGFPPAIVTQLGCLEVDTLRMDIVRIMPQFVDKLYYRSSISLTAYFNMF